MGLLIWHLFHHICTFFLPEAQQELICPGCGTSFVRKCMQHMSWRYGSPRFTPHVRREIFSHTVVREKDTRLVIREFSCHSYYMNSQLLQSRTGTHSRTRTRIHTPCSNLVSTPVSNATATVQVHAVQALYQDNRVVLSLRRRTYVGATCGVRVGEC